jgi:hypothetical protein
MSRRQRAKREMKSEKWQGGLQLANEVGDIYYFSLLPIDTF